MKTKNIAQAEKVSERWSRYISDSVQFNLGSPRTFAHSFLN